MFLRQLAQLGETRIPFLVVVARLRRDTFFRAGNLQSKPKSDGHIRKAALAELDGFNDALHYLESRELDDDSCMQLVFNYHAADIKRELHDGAYVALVWEGSGADDPTDEKVGEALSERLRMCGEPLNPEICAKEFFRLIGIDTKGIKKSNRDAKLLWAAFNVAWAYLLRTNVHEKRWRKWEDLLAARNWVGVAQGILVVTRSKSLANALAQRNGWLARQTEKIALKQRYEAAVEAESLKKQGSSKKNSKTVTAKILKKDGSKGSLTSIRKALQKF